MAAPVFDPSSVALTGRTLIEASAGTGKTFTVTELYLRLVLEQKRKVSEILVLTYTNAATAELRERIRRRLFEARRVAQSDSDDWLTLNLAIESFDEAAIYTIHGFCQRALGDEAFAAGEPFSFELLPYRADAVLTVVKDVWREWGQCFGPLYADFLRQENVSPQSLAAWIDRHVGKPFLRVDGGDNAPSDTTLRTLEDDFSFAYRTASEVWQGSGDSLAGELLNGSLAKNRYSEGIVRRVVDGLSRAFRAPDPHFWGFADLPRVTSSALESATKRGEGTPSHPFIACADALAVAGDALRSGYQRRFAESRRELLLRTEDGLSALSRDQGVKFYDDLMNHLVRALDTASGETLAKRLRIRYPAALIDEFQDTDPAQLHLLRRIYAEDSATVIYVGDPKQAIYGFRGADVFAYLRARADADRVLSLGTNFRSTPHLVEGVNALFTRHGRPFLTDGISYAPVKPRADVRDALRIDGRRSAPVQLMTAAPGEAKGSASRAAALGCVGEIKHLIELGNDGRAVLGERALRGGDIAVVVRTHAQAQLIYRALRHEAISAVYRSNEDVFQTAEAFELCALLAAVMHPSDEALTRRALASPLLGFNAAQLHQLGEEVSAYETILTHLFDAQRRWRTNHFGDAFRFLIRAFGIDTYVLRLAEGERTLTNLFHLGEYLAALSAREGLGCERLMSWLQNRLETPRPDDEAAMVRPDTDESMVQVVTIHASKGLEYPVVFCPFGWAGSGRRVGGTLTYHAPDHERTPVLDVGPDFDDQTIDTAREEERAEDVRLLYVGLTRAMHRLYLSVSFARDYEKSALAWLLHADEDESLSAFEQRVKSSDPGILWSDVEALRSAGKRGIALYEPPSGQLSLLGAQAPARYRARRVGRTFDVSRVLTSHSGIVAGRHREEPDYDDAPEDRDEFDAEGESIHSFPRGAVAGSCLHRILEDIDFAATDASTFAHPIQSALQSYGIDIGWAAMLHGWFAELASVPLDRAGTVTLQSACGKPLGREVEFHYPLRGADENEIHRVLERFDPNLPTESRPARQIPAGFLKGFIDLVFEVDGRYYVADYKSNWLGASIDAYHPRALQSAMTTHSYDLQALFYSVALHRFLKMRLADYQPSEHFGGAVYLFLRGLSRSAPRSHSVVWMTPTPDTLQFAEEVICGAG